ncbi:MAG: permease [Deltaproteobacteria bacterium]|nr:permease [Deltaproteobacteria bacterium]
MTVLWLITGVALCASLIADLGKTRLALVRGVRMFRKILPMLLGMLAVVSVVMAAVTPALIERILSGSGPLSFFAALGVGGVILMPGFVAYPLAGVLKAHGASVAVLSAFITSLMMVGVLTLPIEARFFGWKIAVLRNALALVGAIVVAAAMAWVLG